MIDFSLKDEMIRQDVGKTDSANIEKQKFKVIKTIKDWWRLNVWFIGDLYDTSTKEVWKVIKLRFMIIKLWQL